jgi:hypothetical protein
MIFALLDPHPFSLRIQIQPTKKNANPDPQHRTPVLTYHIFFASSYQLVCNLSLLCHNVIAKMEISYFTVSWCTVVFRVFIGFLEEAESFGIHVPVQPAAWEEQENFYG